MLVIKRIEFFETDRDPLDVLYCSSPNVPVDGVNGTIDFELFRELIRGREFVRPSDGKRLVVGCSKEAQEVLGMMYDAWAEMEDRIESLEADKRHLTNFVSVATNALEEIRDETFWQRVKRVFRG